MNEWNIEDPEFWGEYFITWRGKIGGVKMGPFIEIAEFDSGWDVRHIEQRGYSDIEVLAWMPLPETYKGD